MHFFLGRSQQAREVSMLFWRCLPLVQPSGQNLRSSRLASHLHIFSWGAWGGFERSIARQNSMTNSMCFFLGNGRAHGSHRFIVSIMVPMLSGTVLAAENFTTYAYRYPYGHTAHAASFVYMCIMCSMVRRAPKPDRSGLLNLPKRGAVAIGPRNTCCDDDQSPILHLGMCFYEDPPGKKTVKETHFPLLFNPCLDSVAVFSLFGLLIALLIQAMVLSAFFFCPYSPLFLVQ